MKFWLLGISLLGLTACTGVSFHSNLDPRNVVEYYKPSSVEVIENDTDLDNRAYKVLSHVNGMACQLNDRDYIATESDARTNARIKASDLGANAIRFGKCVRIENSPACKVSITCYGDALVVNE